MTARSAMVYQWRLSATEMASTICCGQTKLFLNSSYLDPYQSSRASCLCTGFQFGTWCRMMSHQQQTSSARNRTTMVGRPCTHPSTIKRPSSKGNLCFVMSTPATFANSLENQSSDPQLLSGHPARKFCCISPMGMAMICSSVRFPKWRFCSISSKYAETCRAKGLRTEVKIHSVLSRGTFLTMSLATSGKCVLVMDPYVSFVSSR
mmetsp:Transcript_71430/g.225705  ORF Transcript_71430/g.225705 Transcript_71430/m.225705 type:complete len:206 (+) Transcript_71430:104-721(+)